MPRASDAPRIAAKSLASLNRRLAEYWQDLGKPERAQACEASAKVFEKMAADLPPARSTLASDDSQSAAKRLADYNRRRAAYYHAQGDHECAARCERIAAAFDKAATGAW